MLSKRDTWRWPHIAALIGSGVLAIIIVLVLDYDEWLQEGRIRHSLLEPIELWTVDHRFKWRTPIDVLDPVADKSNKSNPDNTRSQTLAELDYDTKASEDYGLGRWPWDRRVHAQVLDMLKNAGAKTVMFDIVFDYPTKDPAEDRAMIDATRRAGMVFYPVVFTDRDPTDEFFKKAPRHLIHAEVQGYGKIPVVGDLTLPLPGLVEAAAGLGHIQTTAFGGVFRRTPLLYATKGGFVASLPLMAAFRHLGVDPSSIKIEHGQAIRFKPRGKEEIVIPIDKYGRVWINYAGKWGERFVHYPYSWLLGQMRGSSGQDRMQTYFKGKHVILANFTAVSGADNIGTPFESGFPTSEVFLHIMNMVLTKQFLRNATTVEYALCLLIPVILLTASALAGGPTIIIPTFVLVFGAYWLTLQGVFNRAVILPAIAPSLALTVTLILLLLTRFFIVDRERLRFLSVLGSCLPPHTVKIIKENPGTVATLLAGRSRELTIVFADIKGFSVFCQRANASQIQEVLRDYLTAMTVALHEHGGTLDKYMGDGVMAFFGDAEPEGGTAAEREDRVGYHAGNAVRAALTMQKKMAELNATWMSLGQEPHLIRIGLNTGMVAVGNLGTEYLTAYTVIGSEVNKAQRLESAAEPGGLLLSRRTYELARQDGILPEDLPSKTVTLKGIGEHPDVYPVSPEVVAKLTAAQFATK